MLYPVLRRTSPSLALAYVVARVDGIDADRGRHPQPPHRRDAAAGRVTAAVGDAAAVVVAQALVALHGWTFLLGPGFVVGIGNGLILGWMLYRAHLVPRGWALVGIIGGPLVSLSGIAVLLGAYDQVSPWSALATLPEFVWEAFLGVYLTVHGFRRRERAPVPEHGNPRPPSPQRLR